MLIRAMDINDLERIVELEHILFTSTWDVSDFMYEILENQFSYNFVLEVDEQIVGYVGVWIMYEQSQITTVGIDPDYQGARLWETINGRDACLSSFSRL